MDCFFFQRFSYCSECCPHLDASCHMWLSGLLRSLQGHVGRLEHRMPTGMGAVLPPRHPQYDVILPGTMVL